ncbi:hypothetical protein F8154_13390 [Alkaliphilus pronyensis]|uniref:Uncharacterized protein n=1 Tax=Alkaliphilus pronyensis TaxID=1482732 RepID=A0A6I0F1W5_9FIRM|nr:hypothetical protein [Alkaliphilus pronyensis]KAB3530909.1 hypothetical protein F8154_13390 [Alkaliphilus pronyensis]
MKKATNMIYGKRKMIFLAVILSIVVLLGMAYFITFVYGAYINVENYGVREVLVDESSLNFKGYTISSAQAFSGYQYKIKGEDVYIKIRYSMVSRFNRSGNADINIEGNFENVKNVYLQGRKKDDVRLIWSK